MIMALIYVWLMSGQSSLAGVRNASTTLESDGYYDSECGIEERAIVCSVYVRGGSKWWWKVEGWKEGSSSLPKGIPYRRDAKQIVPDAWHWSLAATTLVLLVKAASILKEFATQHI